MKRSSFSLFMLFTFLTFSSAQTEFADVIIDAFYSGVNPDMDNFYGINATTSGCSEVLIDPTVCLGNTPDLLALPSGSYVTVGFTDNYIINAPGQADLFIDEVGAGNEFADVYVSGDFGVSFTYYGEINGGTNNQLDLATIGYSDIVNAVKIVGKDNNGCVPGFDLVRVYGLDAANCTTAASVIASLVLCDEGDAYNLSNLVDGSMLGEWSGENVIESSFEVAGLAGNYELMYIEEDPSSVCPTDTSLVNVFIGICDCAGVVNGDAIIDGCGDCLSLTDPNFNMSCIDCAGILNGESVTDDCGVCLYSIDHSQFNQSCIDCNGVPNGNAVIDFCGECLQMNDPSFNQSCSGNKKVYVPNVFSPNYDGINDVFEISADRGIVEKIISYQIYNRWGAVVFQSSNFEMGNYASWWNGKDKSNELQSGTYLYSIKIEFFNGDEAVYNGAIGVVR